MAIKLCVCKEMQRIIIRGTKRTHTSLLLIAIITILLVLVTEKISVAASSGITGYKCANETVCDSDCMKLHQIFVKEYSHGWAVRHDSLGATYARLKCKVCVEIGVARGELSDYLLKHVAGIEEYHGVDPFLGGYDDINDAMSAELSKVNSSNVWANTVNHVLSHHGCKFRLHQGFSADAVPNFPPESVDCVFIDGDHTFSGVKADIRSWYPKVKPGGHLLFDDYSYGFIGLVHAVDGFSEINHLPLVQINKHNNYYIQKPLDSTKPITFKFRDFDQGRYKVPRPS